MKKMASLITALTIAAGLVGGAAAEDTNEAREFLQGGDISALYYVISNGGVYKDADGTPLFDNTDDIEAKVQNTVNYLASRGMDFARIRLTNNPGEPGELMSDGASRYHLPAGFEDEDDCLKLAKYAHAAGMKIQFTFNLSDYWSNNHQQYIPVDWQEKIKGRSYDESIAILTKCVADHVTDIMTKLTDEGVYPEYISLGNEISGGILYPYGYSYDTSADDATDSRPEGKKNWNAIASFINAGYDAAKAVSPDTKVIIHLEDMTGTYAANPDDRKGGAFWWFTDFKNAGGKWDVTGISYYPAWSAATIDNCVSFADALQTEYGKPVVVMESGYEWAPTRKDGYNGQLHEDNPVYKGVYDSTPEGQKGFLTELLTKFKASDSIIGSLYWDPMYIHVEDENRKNMTGWAHYYDEKGSDTADVNVVENTTLFDFDGKALPAFEAYEENAAGNAILYIYAGYDANGVLTAVQRCSNPDEFDHASMSGLRVKVIRWTGAEFLPPENLGVTVSGDTAM